MATPKVYVICDANCKFEGMTKEQILAAIVQAVNEGTIGDIDTGFITTIKTINGLPLRFFVGEQSAYEALTEEEKNNLFAIITNDTTKAGIAEAIKTLQDDLKETTKGLIDGSLVVKNATNAKGLVLEKKKIEINSGISTIQVKADTFKSGKIYVLLITPLAPAFGSITTTTSILTVPTYKEENIDYYITSSRGSSATLFGAIYSELYIDVVRKASDADYLKISLCGVRSGQTTPSVITDGAIVYYSEIGSIENAD